MKVKDMMTRDVLSVDKDERLETVLDMMRKHRITKMPVLENGHVVGVISDGEIADELGALKNRGIATAALHASSAMRRTFPTLAPEQSVLDLLKIAQEEDVGLIPVVHDRTPVGVVTKADLLPLVKSDRPLRDIMKTQLHAVDPTDRVIHARRVMLDHGVERLPVLSGGKLVGIVGETDVAFGLQQFKKKYADHHQSEQIKRFFVEDIMVRNVVTATPDTKAADAARTMHDQHVGALPVLHSTGKIAGMVTRTDLVRLIPVA